MSRIFPTSLFVLLSGLACGADLQEAKNGSIPELIARDQTKYSNVVVTKREQERVSFRHDDGVTTLPWWAFDDNNLERLTPGHLASLKAKQVEADAKELQRELTRDAQRKEALERNPGAAARAKKEDDIREAAIRFVMTHFEPPDLTKVSAVILEIDRDTPSDEFLKRFANHKPPVQKVLRSRKRELTESELSCWVGGLKWITATEAEIFASRVIGEAAVSFAYTVRLTAKGWEIVQIRITGIS